MGDRIAKSLAFLFRHLGPLLGLTALIYLPYFAFYRGLVISGILPEDAAAAVAGLFGVFITPLATGAATFMMNRWYDGEAATIKDGLVAAKAHYMKLLVAFITVAFITMGWLAVTIIPCYVLLQVFKISQPFYLLPFVAAVICYVNARYSFLFPLIVVDDLGPYHARSRSSELVKGHRGMVFALGLVSFILPLVFEIAGEAPSLGIGKGTELESLLAWAGVVSAVLSLWPQALFFLYYRELNSQYLNRSVKVA